MNKSYFSFKNMYEEVLMKERLLGMKLSVEANLENSPLDFTHLTNNDDLFNKLIKIDNMALIKESNKSDYDDYDLIKTNELKDLIESSDVKKVTFKLPLKSHSLLDYILPLLESEAVYGVIAIDNFGNSMNISHPCRIIEIIANGKANKDQLFTSLYVFSMPENIPNYLNEKTKEEDAMNIINLIYNYKESILKKEEYDTSYTNDKIIVYDPEYISNNIDTGLFSRANFMDINIPKYNNNLSLNQICIRRSRSTSSRNKVNYFFNYIDIFVKNLYLPYYGLLLHRIKLNELTESLNIKGISISGNTNLIDDEKILLEGSTCTGEYETTSLEGLLSLRKMNLNSMYDGSEHNGVKSNYFDIVRLFKQITIKEVKDFLNGNSK
ncbi:hypothetical protein DOK57_00235 [Campylobacter coli]|nr:hypothetical protein [Campylobacter coli]